MRLGLSSVRLLKAGLSKNRPVSVRFFSQPRFSPKPPPSPSAVPRVCPSNSGVCAVDPGKRGSQHVSRSPKAEAGIGPVALIAYDPTMRIAYDGWSRRATWGVPGAHGPVLQALSGA